MRIVRTMRALSICSVFTFVISLHVTGCFNDIDPGTHPCDTCLPCEECIPDDEGAYCQAVANDYLQCGNDGNIHWFDSCDADEGVSIPCLNDSLCENTSDAEAVCVCINHWEGVSCEECPGNWDPNKDCAECEGLWIDEDNDCGSCLQNWDPSQNCNECLGNWDIEQNCKVCLNQWIDEDDDCSTCPPNWDGDQDCAACLGNWDIEYECEVCLNQWIDEDNDCGTCPPNWDPSQNCSDCLGNWDSEQNCEFCLNQWIDEDNDCGTCPPNWDEALDCAVCLGNWDIKTGCKTCLYHWIDEGNDCGTCPGNWDPNQNCNACIGNWDPNFDCAVCENHWIDEDNNCYTCPGNWDPTQDCNDCIDNWDPAQNCEVCTGENDTEVTCGDGAIEADEECDDCNYTNWDGCYECKIIDLVVSFDANFTSSATPVSMGENGGFVVTWGTGDLFDGMIYGKLFDTYGVPLGTTFCANTLSSLGSDLSVAMAPDGRFVIVWRGSSSESSIMSRLYNSDGTPVSTPLSLQTGSANDFSPAVAMANDGSFVVTWIHYNGPYYRTVHARLYNSDGTPLGGQFQVNPDDTGTTEFLSIGMGSDGTFVITWDSIVEGIDDAGVSAQKYAANGSQIGDTIHVNTYTTYEQTRPSVGVGDDGKFVIAWQSRNQDGDGYGILARIFDSEGSPIGDEFIVNTYTDYNQTNPAVAMSGDGRFVITWDSIVQDQSGTGIFAQRYEADGIPVGEEFRINLHTVGNQSLPEISATPNGNFTVVWSSDSTDIFAQRFDLDGNPLGTLPWDHFQ